MTSKDKLNIIKKAPIPYCCVKLTKDNNQINNVLITDTNYKFDKLLKSNQDSLLNKSLLEILNINIEEIQIDNIVKKCKTNEEYYIKAYINYFYDYYKIDITHISGEEFCLWFSKTDQIGEGLINRAKTSDEMMWIKSKDGKYMYVNEEYKKIMNVDDIVGKYANEVYSTQHFPNIINKEDELVIGKKQSLVKYTVENGLWYKVKVVPLIDNENNIIATFGIAKDINNYDDKESHQRCLLENIIKSIPDGFYYKNLSGVYITCNKEFENILGYENNEIIGKRLMDLSDDKTLIEMVDQGDKDVIETKKNIIIETIVCNKKSKQKHYLEVMKSPVFDNDNKLVGIIGVCREISHRKIIEEKNNKTKCELNYITENLPDVLIVTQNSKIHYISNSCEFLLGVTSNEIYNDNSKFLLNIDKKYVLDVINESVKDECSIIFPINYKGEERWLWLRGNNKNGVYNKSGKRVSILSDITAQKKSEIEFERLRMEFFANLSHEFRTPLNLIFSSIQLLSSREVLEGSIKDRYLDIIKQNGYRLLKLVDNLIDSTKIGSGCFLYNPQNQDIVLCIESLCQSVVEFAKQNNIEVIFDTDIEEKTISFDIYNMERIILNLLSNAIKFNDKENGKIEVNLTSTKENILISIKDNGIGIEKENLDDIFKMFKQINNRFTKISEGSGIGLSLVKSLVDMHDGEIEVKSEIGVGSEFIIKLKNEIMKVDADLQYSMNLVQDNIERMKVEFSDIYV